MQPPLLERIWHWILWHISPRYRRELRMAARLIYSNGPNDQLIGNVTITSYSPSRIQEKDDPVDIPYEGG
jgi:hypothetical protein